MVAASTSYEPAILLLLTGRQAGLAQLSGPGVLELETRAATLGPAS